MDVVLVTKNGMVKRTNVEDFRKQSRGGGGVAAMGLAEGDGISVAVGYRGSLCCRSGMLSAAVDEAFVRELFETVKIYNPVPAEAEESYRKTVLREFAAYCQKEKKP